MARKKKARPRAAGANPYLDDFRALGTKYKRLSGGVFNMTSQNAPRPVLKMHNRYCDKYAYAVPNNAALDAIAAHSTTIVELGGGLGYWAMLLDERGVDIVVYDNWSWMKPDNLWHPVQEGDVPQALAHPDRDLMMVWPPEGDMAARTLRHWQGDSFIYVGEMMRGSGDSDFFLSLVKEWSPVTHVELPHWYNRCDDLWIFKRTSNPDPSWLTSYLATLGVQLELKL